MKTEAVRAVVILAAVLLGMVGFLAWNRPEPGGSAPERSRVAGNILENSALPHIKINDKNRLTGARLPAHKSAAVDIDSLMQDGSAQASLRAFEIIERCFLLQTTKRVIASLPPSEDNDFIRKQSEIDGVAMDAYCQSVSQRQFADRTQLAEKAVVAGVAGAANAFYAAGPNGFADDLYYRADDPGVVAWKAKAISYLKRDADTGDVNAIAQLSNIFSGQFGGTIDITQALGYEMALREALKQSGATKNLQKIDPGISLLQSQATESEMSGASAIAKSVIDNCCKKN